MRPESTPEVSPKSPPKMAGLPPEMGTPEVSRARIRINFGVRGYLYPPKSPPKMGLSLTLQPHFGGYSLASGVARHG